MEIHRVLGIRPPPRSELRIRLSAETKLAVSEIARVLGVSLQAVGEAAIDDFLVRVDDLRAWADQEPGTPPSL